MATCCLTTTSRAWRQRATRHFWTVFTNVLALTIPTSRSWLAVPTRVSSSGPKAGSTESIKVTEALESGISIDGPSGKISIDPTTHHCVLNVSLAEVQDKKFKILQTFDQAPPSDTSAVCNLKKNPKDNQQYVIKA